MLTADRPAVGRSAQSGFTLRQAGARSSAPTGPRAAGITRGKPFPIRPAAQSRLPVVRLRNRSASPPNGPGGGPGACWVRRYEARPPQASPRCPRLWINLCATCGTRRRALWTSGGTGCEQPESADQNPASDLRKRRFTGCGRKKLVGFARYLLTHGRLSAAPDPALRGHPP
jgi:hypothetical protein